MRGESSSSQTRKAILWRMRYIRFKTSSVPSKLYSLSSASSCIACPPSNSSIPACVPVSFAMPDTDDENRFVGYIIKSSSRYCPSTCSASGLRLIALTPLSTECQNFFSPDSGGPLCVDRGMNAHRPRCSWLITLSAAANLGISQSRRGSIFVCEAGRFSVGLFSMPPDEVTLKLGLSCMMMMISRVPSGRSMRNQNTHVCFESRSEDIELLANPLLNSLGGHCDPGLEQLILEGLAKKRSFFRNQVWQRISYTCAQTDALTATTPHNSLVSV